MICNQINDFVLSLNDIILSNIIARNLLIFNNSEYFFLVQNVRQLRIIYVYFMHICILRICSKKNKPNCVVRS